MQTPKSDPHTCSADPETSHRWDRIDSWPDRAYDGSTVWKSKFYCVYCLEIRVTSDKKGGRGSSY